MYAPVVTYIVPDWTDCHAKIAKTASVFFLVVIAVLGAGNLIRIISFRMFRIEVPAVGNAADRADIRAGSTVQAHIIGEGRRHREGTVCQHSRQPHPWAKLSCKQHSAVAHRSKPCQTRLRDMR